MPADVSRVWKVMQINIATSLVNLHPTYLLYRLVTYLPPSQCTKRSVDTPQTLMAKTRHTVIKGFLDGHHRIVVIVSILTKYVELQDGVAVGGSWRWQLLFTIAVVL